MHYLSSRCFLPTSHCVWTGDGIEETFHLPQHVFRRGTPTQESTLFNAYVMMMTVVLSVPLIELTALIKSYE